MLGKWERDVLRDLNDALIAIHGSTITVRKESNGALAAIYSDDAGTPLANPFSVAGDESTVSFYASLSDRYRIDIEKDSLTRTLREESVSTPPIADFVAEDVLSAESPADVREAIGANNNIWCGTATGTANALVLTPDDPVPSLFAGLTIRFLVSTPNTGAVTVAVSGLSAVNLTKLGTIALSAGDLAVGMIASATYDGTRFQLNVLVAQSAIPVNDILANGDANFWLAGSSFTGLTATAHICDMAYFTLSGSGTWRVDRSTDVPSVALAGRKLNYSIWARCTSADATVNAADRANLQIMVEGFDYARLFGITQTLQFCIKSNKTGIYAAALRNSSGDGSYVQSFTIDAANTWEKKVITVSGTPLGTWNFTNGTGLALDITFVCGSNYVATPGLWLSTDKLGVAGTVNLADSSSNEVFVAGVRLVPGNDASNTLSPSYSNQFHALARYYETTSGVQVVNQTGGPTTMYATYNYRTPKRTTPVVTLGTGAVDAVDDYRVVCRQASVASGSLYNTNQIILDARL